MREQLGMTPYMMQIALNQTLKQYFKGKKYAGPGGTKELNFYEQDLPISEDTDDDVDFPAACSPYIITELGDIKSPVVYAEPENVLHTEDVSDFTAEEIAALLADD